MENIKNISSTSIFWGSLIAFLASTINSGINTTNLCAFAILTGILVCSTYMSVIFFRSLDSNRFKHSMIDNTLRLFIFFSHLFLIISTGIAVHFLNINYSITLIALIVLVSLSGFSWLIYLRFFNWERQYIVHNSLGILFDLYNIFLLVSIIAFPEQTKIEMGVVASVMIFVFHFAINLFKPIKNNIIETYKLV